jgi:charged multivesicular body protein 2B
VEILAKQLVKIRNQKAQSFQASGQIQGLATQNTMMASNIRMADAMQVSYWNFVKINFSYFQSTAKTMAKMNKVMNPAHMSKVTQQFTQEHTKLGIKGEMSM